MFTQTGVLVGTNAQESVVDMTTVETEASYGNGNQVWVRPQRNRGIYQDVPGVPVACVVVVVVVWWHFIMFPFHWGRGG